jgi:GNAT superfamily N-acetyltransferase
LSAAGVLRSRVVNGSMSTSAPRVRALTLKDVDAILEIDSAVTKTPVKHGDNDLWRLIAETTTCFGAEIDGKLAGFVLADIRPWEFGRRAHVGWVIALGVRPDAQGKGIGRLLGERVLDQFQRLGVTRVQTIVEPETADLGPYFEALGFKETDARVLVRDMGK